VKGVTVKHIPREAFSTVAGRRRRQRSTVLVAAAVLTWWFSLVLGSDLPWLLTAVAVALIAVWVLRKRRAIAGCVAIAACTAAALAVTSVILTDRQVSGAPDVVAVLTGYILVVPVPALVACTLRPALVARPISTLLGSAVLLLGAVPVVVLGDHGEGATALIVALSVSVAVVWYRHRRAAVALLAALPLVNGWTDLGRRTLPDGSRIDRLLVGDGQAIACSTITTSTALEEDFLAAARRAAATAAALGMASGRVQPVVLTDQETPGIERHLVNDGDVAASVIVTGQSHIADVIRLAPRRRMRGRGAVLAVLLPVPTARAMTR
jgi:hypothetical protein